MKKFIKIFEEFGIGYEQIETDNDFEHTPFAIGPLNPFNKYDQFSSDKAEKFTLEEINKVKDNVIELLIGDVKSSKTDKNLIYFELYKSIGAKEFRKLVTVYKYRDEWFSVTAEKLSGLDMMIFYKCDQLDGLMNCLNNIKENIQN